METREPLSEALLEKLREGKMVQLAPKGISMIPFIRGEQDKVLVRKEETVGVGDIDGSRLILMGDGNLQGTEVVETEEVLGTVLQIIKPNGRYRKPGKAWLWRHLLPCRRYLLKMNRKWNKFIRKQK